MMDADLHTRVTSLEVTVKLFAENTERRVAMSEELLRKMDGQLDEERLSRREAVTAEREDRQAAMTAERESRIAASTIETTARTAIASDLRAFQIKITASIGAFIFVAQLTLSIFGPAIRKILGVGP